MAKSKFSNILPGVIIIQTSYQSSISIVIKNGLISILIKFLVGSNTCKNFIHVQSNLSTSIEIIANFVLILYKDQCSHIVLAKIIVIAEARLP